MSTDLEVWADKFADELAGFEHAPCPIPETGSARMARERREAAERQRRSRAKRQQRIEVSEAIARGLGRVVRRSGVARTIRAQRDLEGVRVSLFNAIGETMTILVKDYGWDCAEAAKAVNDRLMR